MPPAPAQRLFAQAPPFGYVVRRVDAGIESRRPATAHPVIARRRDRRTARTAVLEWIVARALGVCGFESEGFFVDVRPRPVSGTRWFAVEPGGSRSCPPG